MTATTLAIIVCLSQHGLPTQAVQPTATSVQSVGVREGIAKMYGPSYGDLSRMAAYRGVGLCTGCDGFASRPSCKTIGSVFMARVNGHTLKLAQVDCAQPYHLAKQLRDGLVVELSWTLAKRTGLSKRGVMPAQVWEAGDKK